MKLLAIVHEGDGGPGVFADVAREQDAHVEAWWIARGQRCPEPPHAYDAVLTLGGSMHAHQHAEHPWLADEERVLREVMGAGRPVLGICLGSQILARAGGGTSGLLSEPEIGWHPVQLTAAGRADRLLGSLGPRFEALQWHSCHFTPPSGAARLATSERCLQAYRLGDRAWGLQFHPEVTLPDFESWIESAIADPHDDDGPADPEAFRAQTRAAIAEWNELGRGLFERFLAAARDAREAAAA